MTSDYIIWGFEIMEKGLIDLDDPIKVHFRI